MHISPLPSCSDVNRPSRQPSSVVRPRFLQNTVGVAKAISPVLTQHGQNVGRHAQSLGSDCSSVGETKSSPIMLYSLWNVWNSGCRGLNLCRTRSQKQHGWNRCSQILHHSHNSNGNDFRIICVISGKTFPSMAVLRSVPVCAHKDGAVSSPVRTDRKQSSHLVSHDLGKTGWLKTLTTSCLPLPTCHSPLVWYGWVSRGGACYQWQVGS